MSYRREIPRDLFNESKLLKSLGQLSLIALDYGGFGTVIPIKVELKNPERGFSIEQEPGSGDIFCRNVVVTVEGGYKLKPLYSTLNSRQNYSLYCPNPEGGDDIEVLTQDGHLTTEFVHAIDRWKRQRPDKAKGEQ